MNTPNENGIILHAAFSAWQAAATLRARRLRNKRFTYGDQWIDKTLDERGKEVTEWQLLYSKGRGAPITNNVLRQLVKTIVGRFRAIHLKEDENHRKSETNAIAESNSLNELDSRLLEEFLISGCAIQRIDEDDLPEGGSEVKVSNVNLNDFFINAITDPLARDCEIIGQIHDFSVAELIKHVAQGSRKKAAWVRRLYSDGADERTHQLQSAIGADTKSGTDFFYCKSNKCRAIEVWTLESQEVMVCHNHATAQLFTVPVSQEKKMKANPDITCHWDIATRWHCRWFSPMGDLLASYDSPFEHGSHPFTLKFYPLTDGEVHSFIEDVIDQQKYINRLITLVDQIMSASAKGVLLYPLNALPDGFTWSDVLNIWSRSKGILPYNADNGMAKPEQMITDNSNIGAYDMLQLQMKLLEEISGVSGAMQGQSVNTSGSATLYQTQADNSVIALTDIFDTFNSFRRQRDNKIQHLHANS